VKQRNGQCKLGIAAPPPEIPPATVRVWPMDKFWFFRAAAGLAGKPKVGVRAMHYCFLQRPSPNRGFIC
jgi:hypothetical protein